LKIDQIVPGLLLERPTADPEKITPNPAGFVLIEVPELELSPAFDLSGV